MYFLQSQQGHFLSICPEFCFCIKISGNFRFSFFQKLIPTLLEQEKVFLLFQSTQSGFFALQN